MKVIIWTRPDGHVSMTSLALQDSTRPPGDTEDDLVQRAIAREQSRLEAKYGAPCTAVVVNDTDLPMADHDDFFDAWECPAGTVQVNMSKARTLHMDTIRGVRNKELERLDVSYIVALEAGDTTSQTQIAAEKQTLRDVPQTFDLNGFSTPADLRAAWPDGLPPKT